MGMLKQEEKKRSLREQSAWLLTAKLIGFALSFILPLLIVRNLALESVGHYREAFQVIMNAVVILPLGFSMSAYYFLAREKERRAASILNILIFNFVVGGLACLLLFLYPQIIGNIFRSEELTRLAPLIGIVIWIWVFSTFLETVAIANQEARVATVFIISAQFSKTLLMGAAVFAFATVESFIYAAIIQGTIQTLLLIWYLGSRFSGFWRSFDPAFFWEQMRYAIPFGLTGILWMAQYDIHNYFVGYQFTSAEFAIYAYGCFEVPLIAMLSESVSSVLIPKMNELQQKGDRDEMIRLTARAMQKLALIYFPVYVFLFITSRTFITTLFTEQFEMSASIFAINITLLPFAILITDPVVRSFKELGRIFLLTRVLVLTGMVSVLYFSIGQVSLTGVITIAVAAVLIEKVLAETMVIRKLELGTRHLHLLKPVGKTAIAAIIAGLVTCFVYNGVHKYLQYAGEHFIEDTFDIHSLGVLNFFGGSLVLFICGIVFAPIYLLIANGFSLIDDSEKDVIRRYWNAVFARGKAARIVETQA
jgi:O-antigen/teichoic acid export membrane protein